MTLSQADLTDALHNALKAADPPCTRFCVAGASMQDGHYAVFHNGVGNHATNTQAVTSDKVRALSKDAMSAILRAWVNGVHRGRPTDLNAALAIDTSGPAMLGWPWTLRYDPASGITVATITVTSNSTNVGETPYITTTLSPNVNTTWRWSDGSAP